MFCIGFLENARIPKKFSVDISWTKILLELTTNPFKVIKRLIETGYSLETRRFPVDSMRILVQEISIGIFIDPIAKYSP